MNARIANQENELLAKDLLEGADEVARRLNHSLEDEILRRVELRKKLANNDTAKAAWDVRGQIALSLIAK